AGRLRQGSPAHPRPRGHALRAPRRARLRPPRHLGYDKRHSDGGAQRCRCRCLRGAAPRPVGAGVQPGGGAVTAGIAVAQGEVASRETRGVEMGRQPVESTLAIFSNANRTGRWRAQGVTQATAVFGACTIDLRGAEIEGEHLVVKASAVFGSIHIVVTEHTDVELDATALLGSINDRRTSTDTLSGPSVRVEGFALFGAVTVAHKAVKELEEEQTSIDEVAEAVAEERPPLHHGAAPDGTTTVLFSDIEGFTAMNDRLGDREAFEVLKGHNQIVRDQVDAF